MANIPPIKKNISSFLLGEEGKISKQSLIKIGAFLGTAAISSALLVKSSLATHTNDLDVNEASPGSSITAEHSHHSSHSSGGGGGGGM